MLLIWPWGFIPLAGILAWPHGGGGGGGEDADPSVFGRIELDGRVPCRDDRRLQRLRLAGSAPLSRRLFTDDAAVWKLS